MPGSFLGDNPLTQFCHSDRQAERSHSDHYAGSEPASQLSNSLVLKAERYKPPSFYVFGAMQSGIEPGLLHPKRTLNHCAMGNSRKVHLV